jgi:hypothetical protein
MQIDIEPLPKNKNHRAIDLALNKVLTNNIVRQAKRTGAICSNDAKACYDLIGHAQASLCMQHQGGEDFWIVRPQHAASNSRAY